MPSNEIIHSLTGAAPMSTKSPTLPKAVTSLALPSLANNSALLEYMASFINHSYHSNYDGLVDTSKHTRTSASELSQKIRNHQIAIAWKSKSDLEKEIAEDIIGCVGVELIGPNTGNLTLLTCHLEHRGTRVAQQLMEFAEDWARGLGADEMQLEILVPDGWEHEENSRVVRWAN
ncbi:hypothetical protein V8C42DRAFT_345465 [Trichoderma barbatum]